MKFAIIVACAENDVIGYKGDMPWKKLTSDLRFFKETTMGHWCILGRKTYNALGNKVLPGRKFIIITRDKTFEAHDSLVVHTLSDALTHPVLQEEEEVMVLGGGEIYRQALPYCHRIYLTRIHVTFHGDTFFPDPDPAQWELINADKRYMDEKNPYNHTFMLYERIPETLEQNKQ